MKYLKHTLAIAALAAAALVAPAQEQSQSGAVMRRGAADRNKTVNDAGLTDRMQGFYNTDGKALSDADLQWMRVIYRNLDLEKEDANAPLYFPEEPVDGQENLFRIIMRLLADNKIPAYEYLDGREIFTDKYRIAVRDMLDRFYIIYQPAKGSTEKNPRFTIEEADVPANEVLSYFVIEKWVFDTRNNRLRPTVEAICPVLHRAGDFGGDAVKYPMFWIKYSDLRPYLAQQTIFVTDDNNLPTCTYDDFFNLTMYKGDIYKTRNLRNKSMAQMFPDPDDRKRAQDSIQSRLDNFESKLWTPTRDELLARAEAKDKAEAGNDSTQVSEDKPVKSARATRSTARRSKKKPAKVKESSASRSSSATRSVRRRK